MSVTLGIDVGTSGTKTIAIDGRGTIRALAMLHPAYLLRSPAQKRAAWADLRALAAALGHGL